MSGISWLRRDKMIKIICPKCASDDIWDIGEEYEISEFRCDNCNYEFKLNISQDVFEFESNY